MHWTTLIILIVFPMRHTRCESLLKKLPRVVGEMDVQNLKSNQKPTRREQVQSALAKLDPMAEHLDSDIRQRKRDTIHKLWQKLEGYAHHQTEQTVEGFSECLTILERTVLDLLAPITAQDQQEIRSILDRPVRLESDIERLLSLIERRGANFVFFFKHVNDAAWIPILDEKGYFAHPPGVEPIGDDRINFPFGRRFPISFEFLIQSLKKCWVFWSNFRIQIILGFWRKLLMLF